MNYEKCVFDTIRLVTVLIIALSVGQGGLAQTFPTDSIPTVERRLWKINFLVPGAEFETALGSFSTVNINPYVGLGYSYISSLGDAWLVQPSIDVQFRRYYNLLKRNAKGKRTAGNSANYLAIDVLAVGRSVVDGEDFRNFSYYGLGPVWGMQRTFRSNFNLSFQAGAMYTQSQGAEDGWIVRLNLRLGLALTRKGN